MLGTQLARADHDLVLRGRAVSNLASVPLQTNLPSFAFSHDVRKKVMVRNGQGLRRRQGCLSDPDFATAFLALIPAFKEYDSCLRVERCDSFVPEHFDSGGW